jgi:hypothetical protein
MTIYIPNKSSHRADTKYAVFKNISSDFNRFCDEKQKRVQKRVQRVQFWSTKSTPSTPSTLENLYSQKKKMYSFVLERVQSGHPEPDCSILTCRYLTCQE